MKNEKIKKIIDTVLNVLIWIFVVFSVLVTVLVFAAQGSSDGIPDLFGTSLVSITSESMTGTFNKGDLVFMKKITEEEKLNLSEGNIITFRFDQNGDGKQNELNTHRIVGKDGDLTFITKGDANTASDPVKDRVHISQIVGVCDEGAKIPAVGGVISFLREPLGFFLCIVLPLILFFLFELYNFIALLISERKKTAQENEEEIKRRAIEEYLKTQNITEETNSTDETVTENVTDNITEENNTEES